MFIQQRCALRGNFLILVFTFPIFHKRKGGIFQVCQDKRSLFGNSCWISFFRIPFSLKISQLFIFLLEGKDDTWFFIFYDIKF